MRTPSDRKWRTVAINARQTLAWREDVPIAYYLMDLQAIVDD